MERIRVGRLRGGRPRTRPDRLGGDKTYSPRRYLRRRQIKHTIPEPKNRRPNRQRRGSRGGQSSDDIDLARAGSSIDPKRATVTRFAQPVVESRGQVSDADLSAVRGAGCTGPQLLAIVTVAVRVLLTNFTHNVNQTDIDITAVSSVGTPG
ncbi:hypothetical protein AB0M87_30980 [Streptomyces sp. NPDC051320]|uniref:hypothetical protein n=1 Tax=Streptomyces sp. NPDC051320 TaxID=3154644 RepID=UPI0034339C68